jgi:hypothetical protein
MRKTLLVLCLIWFACFKANSEGAVKNATVKPIVQTHVLQNDSSKITIRNFNSKAIEQYRKNEDFNYYRDEDLHNLSWWDRFWRWFWQLLRELFGKKEESTGRVSPVVQYIALGLAIFALIYVIIKLVGVANIFGRESQEVAIPYSESLENIHEITFDEELEKALNQRNYRLGVRLLYLRSLKYLNDARLIEWQIDKTNAAYLNELANSDQRQSFTVLTRQFEYVWYGDFPIDSNSYQNISTLFQDFKKMLP